MATGDEANVCCSMCSKQSARCFCIGCKQHFCSKDFKEHEQNLATRFDDEVVRYHDELLYQMNSMDDLGAVSSDLFAQIEQWRVATITNVEQAASRARQELTELINRHRTQIKKQLELITAEIRHCREEENFLEHDIDRLKGKICGVQNILDSLSKQYTSDIVLVHNAHIDWSRIICIRDRQDVSLSKPHARLYSATKWNQHGLTVAGGNGYGIGMNKLYHPWGLYVDDNRTIYVAEYSNHRIVAWRLGATNGEIIAGGNGQGNRLDQLSCPTGFVMDKRTKSLFICDSGNRRVVRWPRQDGLRGETILSDVGCHNITIDNNGLLYVVDYDQHVIRRYRIGESQGVVVAGGHGPGDRLDQLHHPRHVFVDDDNTLYISDSHNHRIMKWIVGQTQGIVVAGGKGSGNSLSQLSLPYGVAVDGSGMIYVADYSNHRIIRWNKEASEGMIVIGNSNNESRADALFGPISTVFDLEGNLYVSDYGNFRVKRFDIEHS